MLSNVVLHRIYCGNIALVRIGVMLQKYEKLEEDEILFVLDKIVTHLGDSLSGTELCLIDNTTFSLLSKEPDSSKIVCYSWETRQTITEVPKAFRVAVYNLGAIQGLYHEK